MPDLSLTLAGGPYAHTAVLADDSPAPGTGLAEPLDTDRLCVRIVSVPE